MLNRKLITAGKNVSPNYVRSIPLCAANWKKWSDLRTEQVTVDFIDLQAQVDDEVSDADQLRLMRILLGGEDARTQENGPIKLNELMQHQTRHQERMRFAMCHRGDDSRSISYAMTFTKKVKGVGPQLHGVKEPVIDMVLTNGGARAAETAANGAGTRPICPPGAACPGSSRRAI